MSYFQIHGCKRGRQPSFTNRETDYTNNLSIRCSVNELSESKLYKSRGKCLEWLKNNFPKQIERSVRSAHNQRTPITTKETLEPALQYRDHDRDQMSTLRIHQFQKNGMIHKLKKRVMEKKYSEREKLRRMAEEQLQDTNHIYMSRSEHCKKLISAKKDNSQYHIKLITLGTAMNGKLTVIRGIRGYGINLTSACEVLAEKFKCAASVSNHDEITIQGDVRNKLPGVLTRLWPEVNNYAILDFGEMTNF